MKRRTFLKSAIPAGISVLLLPRISFSQINNPGELLYNGIQLSNVWPPQNMDRNSYDPMPVPYLDKLPPVIPIDIGRQLFVDDFLVESTTMERKFYNAKKYTGNPILKPETPLEMGEDGLPVACPKDGGVWWDPKDKIFKMWYEAGWLGAMAYATSKDGINWDRPDLEFNPGTNQILTEYKPDSTTVFLDHEAENPKERFKMFFRSPDFYRAKRYTEPHGYSMVSSDGLHWENIAKTGKCGDRSTMFYNPFRKKWVYSIRAGAKSGRARNYTENSDFKEGAAWNAENSVFWTGADKLDPPDPQIGDNAQLYNLSAVAYESLMLGLFEIHLGPKNEICQELGAPKTTELKIAFSRDGFHWDRPNRDAFIPATRKEGSWERGYVQSVGGICNVIGDQLWFYYIGFRGDKNFHPEGLDGGMYANGSTGIATLRRDGFASMTAGKKEGVLITRPVTFNGKYLFVNVNCPQGSLRVEILDKDNVVIEPFSVQKCKPVSADGTICAIEWETGKDIALLAGKEVRFRFYLTDGDLFSFWVSPDKSGASYGYNAAGGPGFEGGKDVQGTKAYKKSSSFQLKEV